MKLFLLLYSLTVTLHTSKIHRAFTGQEEIGMSACTGVFVAPDVILTAQHCVEDSRGKQWIKTNDDKSYEARIIRTDRFRDLALLYIPYIQPHKYVTLGKQAYVTEPVYTVNSGADFPGTYGEGIVKNIVALDDTTSPMIMHSAAILGGASGSGLFNRKGQLIGINVRAKSAISMAVNTSDVKCFLEGSCDVPKAY